MADYINTYSKINFAPLEPKCEDILIDDIAHSLSLMCVYIMLYTEFCILF